MEIPVIEKIKKLPKQTEESLTDAFTILRSIEDRKSVDHYVRWVRSEARKIQSVDMYNLIKDTYFYSARYSFDDFCISLEWYREPEKRFYLPRPVRFNARLFGNALARGLGMQLACQHMDSHKLLRV